MPGERPPSPPGAAKALIRRRLPDDLAEAIAGDLEEEYRRRVRPSRGRLLADLWFWWQALTLRARKLRRVHRRLSPGRWSAASGTRPPVPNDDSTLRTGISMLWNDLKYALRRLVTSPLFAATAVVSLAVGIGANTAIFSLVNAALFRDLPVERPDRVVEVYTSSTDGDPYSSSSYPDYRDLRESADVFSDVVASRTFLGRMDRGAERELVTGELVSWDYFRALGVSMALGRSFLPEEGSEPGAAPVVILGHRTWRRDFGGDPDVLGRSVRLDGRAYTIVGVAPEDFTGTLPVMVTGVYVPLAMMGAVGDLEGQMERRGSRALMLKARLAPGVGVEGANEALAAFSAGLAERYPETNRNRTMSAVPAGDVALHPSVDRLLEPVAALLLVVVGLVLVIACANLASFLLARAEDRRREIAVRLAMGASRGALVRQLLVETVLLAGLGGVGGVVLADWTLRAFMRFQPPLPVPLDFDVSMDGTVLLFTAGVSVLAGLAFGLVPALQSTNPDVAPTLKDEARAEGGRRGFTVRNALVVAQVTLSFVLLIGAGLFVRSFQKAQGIDPGFDTGPAALVRPMPGMAGYQSPEEMRAFYDVYRQRLRAHPAIREVAMASRLPLGTEVVSSHYELPGVPGPAPDGHHSIDVTSVSPAYFEVMDVPIVRGQGFREEDPPSAVVVSEAFVSRFYPDEEVVGRTIADEGGEAHTIVGVARNTKVRTLGEDPRPYLYRRAGPGSYGALFVVARGPGDGPELLAAASSVLEEVDPGMVVMEELTMTQHASIMLYPPRIAALLLSIAGAIALLLAAVGIYGVVSHAVARRTRELGIRISLGASRREVVAEAVRGGMGPALVGAAIGLVLAGGVTWALEGFLYGISATDLATFVAIPLILTGVAFLAAFVPARRASRVDPVRALRTE